MELPINETVATVKHIASEKMKVLLKERYGLILGELKVTVEPQPRAENQQWTELGEGVIIKLGPPDDSMTPLYKEYKSLELKGVSNYCPVDVVLTLSVVDRPTGLGIMKNEELDKMLSDERHRLSAELQEIDKRLQEQSEELLGIKPLFYPMLFRVLMDDFQDLIVDSLGERSWHQIEQGRRQKIVRDEIEKLRSNSQFVFSSSALDMALLLVNDHSKKRKDGNTAAHTGTQEDISAAILTLHQGKERNLFIECYKLAYNQEPIL